MRMYIACAALLAAMIMAAPITASANPTQVSACIEKNGLYLRSGFENATPECRTFVFSAPPGHLFPYFGGSGARAVASSCLRRLGRKTATTAQLPLGSACSYFAWPQVGRSKVIHIIKLPPAEGGGLYFKEDLR